MNRMHLIWIVNKVHQMSILRENALNTDSLVRYIYIKNVIRYIYSVENTSQHNIPDACNQ